MHKLLNIIDVFSIINQKEGNINLYENLTLFPPCVSVPTPIPNIIWVFYSLVCVLLYI